MLLFLRAILLNQTNRLPVKESGPLPLIVPNSLVVASESSASLLGLVVWIRFNAHLICCRCVRWLEPDIGWLRAT